MKITSKGNIFKVALLLAIVSASLLLTSRDSTNLASCFIREARAADSCTDWMKQPNGCWEQVCVDSKGQQYCLRKCGSNVSRVRC